MALTKKKPDDAALAVMNGTATTEDETVQNTDNAQTVDVSTPDDAQAQVVDQGVIAAAKVTATTALATASASASTALAKPTGGFRSVLASYANALPDIEWGVLPRLVGSQGAIKDGDNNRFGTHIDLTLLSFKDYFVISPGDDSTEAKKYVRYSDDGVTINSDVRESVEDYLAYLRGSMGYTDASLKPYTALIGIVDDVENDKNAGDIVGQMVEVSLSPQSRKSFQAYELQRSVAVARGAKPAEGSDQIRIEADTKSQNGKDFTLLKVKGR